jgi:hypothetical protein
LCKSYFVHESHFLEIVDGSLAAMQNKSQ